MQLYVDPRFLAYAQRSGDGSAQLAAVLACLGVLASLAALVAIALLLGRRRRVKGPQGLLVMLLLWWAVAGLAGVAACLEQCRWSREYQMRLASGYLDPTAPVAAPAPPWPLWLILLLVYGGLLAWAAAGPRKNPPAPPSFPNG